MKRRLNPLGLLSLLALIAILGFTTDNNGWFGFFGFFYYIRYFWVRPDELFMQTLHQAATAAFLAEMVALVPLAFISQLVTPAGAAPVTFALSFVVAVFVFTGALILGEWREQRGAAE